MLLLFAISGFLLVANTCAVETSTDDELGTVSWEKFKSDYKKSYNLEEDARRREIWELNVKYITRHNYEADKGEHSYWLGVNQFADWTKAERKSLRSKRTKATFTGSCAGKADYTHGTLPESFDWRTLGVITPVKNQGQCGSPWAFSVTGAIEAREAIYCSPHQLVSLSEQNLLDCSFKYGNDGCYGGLMDNTYHYIMDNLGIDTEASYPYEAKDGKCRFNPDFVGARIRGCVDLPPGNETALEIITYVNGPVAVGIRADVSSFELYKSGVYDDPKCTPEYIDHSALVVGFGSMNGKKYWIVKNSWGTSWGDKGYILIARDHHNECGIATLASYPEMLCDF